MLTRMWVAAQSRVPGETGASLVEYALLVALIALVAITAISTVGDNVSDRFEDIGDTLVDPGGG